MTCQHCGSALTAGMRFCPHCGAWQHHDPELEPAPVLQIGKLTAEYTAGMTPSGEWFALGSIYVDEAPNVVPATILVGTGRSPESAVDDLRAELQRTAERLAV
jgi:hypothetical protein